jgi:hypothetical protein
MFRTSMTLDRAQRAWTIGALVFITGALALTLTGRQPAGLAAFAFTAGALLVAWAMSPRGVEVDTAELRVVRRAWPALRVPLSSVASASPVDRLGRGVLRLFGAGGFFGSYGLFRSDALGRFRLYATHSGQAVLVRRTGRLPIVLTPDDVAGTIRAIDRRPVYR